MHDPLSVQILIWIAGALILLGLGAGIAAHAGWLLLVFVGSLVYNQRDQS